MGRRRVLHLVQRPVPANHHSTFWGIPHEGDAFGGASRSGKPVKAGGTGTGAASSRAERGSPRDTAPARERAWHVRKGRRSRPPSLRGNESRWFGCPHVENAVAEVGKRHLGPKYARQTRSRKGRSGSSERGPSTGRASAGETVGERIERSDVEESGAPDKNGSEPAETQGGVRASSSGLRGWVERPRGGRGTGAVKATGSYEGSLPREGIPGHGKHRSSRFDVELGLGHSPITTLRVSAQQDDARRSTHEGDVHGVVNAGVATGMSEARLVLAPWEENAHARVPKP
jgi:hypothetical protein